MTIDKLAEQMEQWRSDTWHVYACYTHDGGSRLEVNGLGKWRLTRKGELVLHTEDSGVAARAYVELMPDKLQKDFFC